MFWCRKDPGEGGGRAAGRAWGVTPPPRQAESSFSLVLTRLSCSCSSWLPEPVLVFSFLYHSLHSITTLRALSLHGVCGKASHLLIFLTKSRVFCTVLRPYMVVSVSPLFNVEVWSSALLKQHRSCLAHCGSVYISYHDACATQDPRRLMMLLIKGEKLYSGGEATSWRRPLNRFVWTHLDAKKQRGIGSNPSLSRALSLAFSKTRTMLNNPWCFQCVKELINTHIKEYVGTHYWLPSHAADGRPTPAARKNRYTLPCWRKIRATKRIRDALQQYR